MNGIICWIFGHKWLACDGGISHKDSYDCCRCGYSLHAKEYYDKYQTHCDSFDIDILILEEMIEEVRNEQSEALTRWYND